MDYMTLLNSVSDFVKCRFMSCFCERQNNNICICILFHYISLSDQKLHLYINLFLSHQSYRKLSSLKTYSGNYKDIYLL